MNNVDTIKLGFGHNLVRGFIPEVIGIEKFSKIIEKESKADLASFGLFESSTPNYTTYYPEVTAEDLTPKDTEFIEPVYRALSEVIVHRTWNPIDFSKKGVLKASMGLLVGQSIYADHEGALGNAMGAVSNTVWQESTVALSIKVPAGINASMKIDGKSNPRIARGIMMDPPSIHSTSVTVEFLFDRSHEIAENDFYKLLGTYDKDGNMYRRIVNKVRRYQEISFVGHGADAFAQKIGKDGKIINPVYANIANNSALDPVKERKNELHFFYDFKDVVSNSENTILSPKDNIQDDNLKNNPAMTFLESLAQSMGIDTKDLSEEQLQAAITAKLTTMGDVTQLAATIAGLTTTNTSLSAQVSTLTAEVTELKKTTGNPTAEVTALTSFRDSRLTEKRTEVTRLYNLVAGEKPHQAILDMITNSAYEVLTALELQYAQQADTQFPVSCKQCGSTEVNRASAKNQESVDDLTNKNNKDTYTVAQEIVSKKIPSHIPSMHAED